jgi:hypothetical protein
MNCALSASAPLAIAGTEVLESIVRGGLAAPNDVYLNETALITVVSGACGHRDKSCPKGASNCLTK